MGGQRHASAALPLGKTWYSLYKRKGGLQGQSGRVWKISPPPGFDPRTVRLVASRYTDWTIPAHITPDNSGITKRQPQSSFLAFVHNKYFVTSSASTASLTSLNFTGSHWKAPSKSASIFSPVFYPVSPGCHESHSTKHLSAPRVSAG
jgi:hypothetical protein